MSTTVDSRVVEMRFDNKHFESNVSTTMSTLEKLKQSLKFKGATDGFKNLSSAAKNVDMKTLSNSVDTVKVRFSALQTVAVTALANITNSAVNAGKRIVSALTLDPVMSGFKEYETQINSVQTILSNTQHKGTTLDDVNKALDELNHYADKTIYNFTEMTRNIGTFTAAGVDLNTSVQAIKGIANLAAMSGSTSQQASTAMYQLSQALASGTVKLMDWNSVVNAGMGGEVFQNALKETARVHGVAIDQMIKDEGSFRETLTKGWLTSDILTETLAKFTGDLNESQLRTMGYNEEQIKSIMKLGQTANDAATKVKTFTQLIDTTKEALQSGWTQSWEIIIGDFEEAKSLFTEISDMFAPIIESSAEARNSVLEGAFGNGWDVVTRRLKEAGISVETFEEKIKSLAKSNGQSIDEIIKKHGSLGDAFKNGALSSDLIVSALKELAGGTDKASGSIEDATAKLEKFNKVVKQVIRGDFGNGAKRMEALAKAGWDYAQVQALVNKVMAGGKIELSDLSAAQLESIGFTKEQIAVLQELAKEAEATGTPLNELMENLAKPTGRELIIDALKNSFEALKTVIEAVGKAWSNTFGNIESGDIYSIAESVHSFSEKMLDNAKTNAGKIQTIFEGIFAGFQITHSILSMSVVGALKILNAVLELFDMNILDLAVTIAEYIKRLRDWIDENTIFINSWNKIGTAIGNALKIVILWFKSILSWDCVREFFETLGETVLNVFDKIGEVLGQGTNVFEKFSNNIKDILTLSETNPEAAKQKMREWTEKAYSGLSGFAEKVKNYFQNITADDFFADLQTKWSEAIAKIKTFFGKFVEHIKAGLGIAGEGFSKFGDIVGKVVKFIGDCIGKLNINIGSLLAIGAGAALIEIVTTLASALKALSKFKIAVDIPGLTGALKGLETKLKADALIRVAGAIAILAGSILVLSLIPADRLWETIGALGALAGGLIVFAAIFGTLKKLKLDVDLQKISVFAIALSGALLLLTMALEKFKDLDLGTIVKGVGTLAVLGVGIRLFIGSMGKVRAAVNIMQIGVFMLAFAASLKLLASALDDINNIDLSAESIFKLVGVMAGFALVIAAANKIKGGAFFGILGAAIGLKIVLGLIEELSSINSNKIMDSLPNFILVFGMLTTLMISTRLCGKNAIKAAAAIGIISVAMYAMIGVVKLLSSFNVNDLTEGLTAITILGLVISGFIAVSHLAGPNAAKAGVMLMGLSVAMTILAGTIWIMSKIEAGPLYKAVGAISILIGMMSLLVAATNLAKDCKGSLTVMVVAIGLLGILLAALSMIPAKDLQNATKSMVAIMGMLTILVAVMSLLAYTAKFTKGANTSIILLFTCVAGLAGILYLLKDIPVEQSIGNAKALGILMAALSASLVIVSKAGKVTKGAYLSLLKMMGIMVLLGGVLAIINSIDSTNSLANVVAISTLMIVLSTCLRIVSKVTRSTKNAMVGMVSLVGIIAALSFVLNLINAMNPEQTIGNVVAISALLLVMSGCLKILSTVSKSTKKAMTGMVSLVGIITLLGFALTLINALNPEQTYGNVVAVSALLLVMSGCLRILSTVTKSTKNAMKGMVSLVGIITLLGIALTLINALNSEQTYGNVVAVSALLLVMSACLKMLSSVTRSTKNAMKGMASLVGIIALLGVVLTIINTLNPEQTIGNVVAISALLLVMSGCLKILSTITKVSKSAMTGMVKMVGIFALIGAVLAVINALNPNDSMDNVIAVSLVMMGLAKCLAVLKMIGNVPKKAVKTLAMMVPIFLAVGAVMAAVNALNANSSLGETLTNVAGVSALALALAGCMLVLKSIEKPPSKRVLKSLAMMTPIVLALGAVMAAINAMNQGSTFSQTITNVIGVSGLILALSACINSLKTVTGVPKRALKAIYQMIPIVAALGIIFAIMSNITSETSLNNSLALSTLLMSLSTSLFIVSKIPMVPAGAIKGLGSLMVVVALIAAVLGAMDALGIEASLETSAALSTLLLSLTAVFVILGAASGIASAAVSGVFSFIAVVAVIGAFIVAVGALVHYIPEVETFLDEGIPVLEKLAYGIGSFVGNLIGGLSAGALSGLPEIGNHLSNFMTNAQTFIDGAKQIDDSVMDGVGNIVGAVLALTAADFVSSVSSFLGGGESSISKFAAELPALGESISAYADVIKDIDPDVVNASANAVDALSKMANGLPKSGGFLQSFLGESMSMAQFGEHLVSFGKAMVEYSKTISVDGGIDTKAIEASANAASALSELANSLPTTGGKIAEWFGDEMSLTEFGVQLVTFGNCLVEYSKAITADGGIDAKAIESSANAAMALSDLANNLPNVGGKITEWFGDQMSLTEFGTQLKSFGASLIDYSKTITADGGIDTKAIEASATAASSLSELANGLPTTGGKIKEWFLGEDINLATFGEQLVSFGEDFLAYSNYMSGVNSAVVMLTSYAAQALVKLAESLPENKLFKNETTLDEFGSQLAEFGSYFAQYYENISGIDTGQLAAVITEITNLVSMTEVISNLKGNEITDLGKALADVAISGIDSFVNEFAKAKQRAIDAATGMLDQFISGINVKQPDVLKAFSDLATKCYEKLNVFQQHFFISGKTVMAGFINGIEHKISAVEEAARKAVNKAVTVLNMGQSKFYSAGAFCVSGFANGITANTFKAEAAAAAMAKASYDAAMAELDVNSPSKVFMRGAICVPEGFAKGIMKGIRYVVKASESMAQAAIDTTEETLDINSPAKELEARGEYTAWGFSKGIGDNVSMVKDATESMGDAALNGIDEVLTRIRDYVQDKLAYKASVDVSGKMPAKGTGGLEDMFSTTAKGVEGLMQIVSNFMVVLGATEEQIMNTMNKIANRFAEAEEAKRAFEERMNAMKQQASETTSKIKDMIMSAFEDKEIGHPTITPVVDMSNIEEGKKLLSTMFSGKQAASISASMNKSRTETNSDKDSMSSPSGETINFTQNNYSPKSLSQAEIYRQTKNLISTIKKSKPATT